MASCVSTNSESFKRLVKEYKTAKSAMVSAVQTWLDKGNRWNDNTEQDLRNYLDTYFRLNEKQYSDTLYSSALIVYNGYNKKTYESFEEGEKDYKLLLTMLPESDLRLFLNENEEYELHITKPIKEGSTPKNSIQQSSKSLPKSEINNQQQNIDINTISDKSAAYGVEIISGGSTALKNNYSTWQKQHPEGIVAYRVNFNKYATPEEALAGRIGNPFSEDTRGEDTVQQFYEWLTTGNNFDNAKATEEYRQAIIKRILNTPENAPILYYTELNRPSHATVLGYLVNNKQLLQQPAPTKPSFTFNDGKTIETPFALNDEQKKALNEMNEFVNAPDEHFMTLSGYAGTGKTSLMEILAEKLRKEGKTVAFSASTNKAASVLRDKVKKKGYTARTLNSLFGILVEVDPNQKSYDAKNLSTYKSEATPDYGTIVVIDEASMINEKNFQILSKTAEENNLKIIYLGDKAQLAPVGDSKISPVFRNKQGRVSTLTKVERTGDNAILKEATRIRNGEGLSGESSFNSEGKGVAYINSNNSKNSEKVNSIIKAFAPHLKKNPDFFRILTFTNDSVVSYNNKVRRILGYDSPIPRENEPIMGYTNWGYDATKEEKYTVINSESYTVSKVHGDTTVYHYIGTERIDLDATRITIVDSLGNSATVNVIDVKENARNRRNAAILAKRKAELWSMQRNLRKGSKEWREVMIEINTIESKLFVNDNIKDENSRYLQTKVFDFGYAMTIHKSQGSTFTNVLVDATDIDKSYTNGMALLKGEDIPDITQQLNYVAVSRATDTVTILTRDNSVKEDTPLNHVSLPEIPVEYGFSVKTDNFYDKEKAPIKAAISNKFIGWGVEGSSTEKYREQADKQGKLSTEYNDKDVVFVSINGNRPSNPEETAEMQDKTIQEALKALKAGAVLVTDSAEYLQNSTYNIGEKKLAEALRQAGASYKVYANNSNIGLWKLENNKKESNPEIPKKDNTIVTDKLTEARNKIANLKFVSEQNIKKSENFDTDHTYLRKNSKGEWVKVDRTVTGIKKSLTLSSDNIVEPKDTKKDIGPWGLPSSMIGNVNDAIMRGVFSTHNPDVNESEIKDKVKREIIKGKKEGEPFKDSDNNGIISSRQFDILWNNAKETFKEISEFVGDTKWECTTDEIPLLMQFKGEYVAGTPDMIVWNSKGEIYVFDFKTLRNGESNKYLSSNINEWSTQVFTYGNMMNLMAGINVTNGKAIITETYYPDAEREGTYALGNIGKKLEFTKKGESRGKLLYTYHQQLDKNNILEKGFGSDFGIDVSKNPTTGVFGRVIFKELSEPSNLQKSKMQKAITQLAENNDTNSNFNAISETALEGDTNHIQNQPEQTQADVQNIKQHQSLKDIPIEERKMLADYIMHKVTEWLDYVMSGQVQSNDDISGIIKSSPKLQGTFEQRKEAIRKMSRLEVINTLGIDAIFNLIKETEFNEEYNPGWRERTDISEDRKNEIIQNYKIAYDNFKGLCKMGYQKLLTLERISPEKSSDIDLKFFEGDDSVEEASKMDSAEDNEKESWQTYFRNQSAISSLSAEVRRLFENLHDGADRYGYGIQAYVEPYKAITTVQKLIRKCNNMNEMEEILQNNVSNYEWLQEILDAIKENEQTKYNPTRHKFFQNFRKDFVIYSTVVPTYDRKTGTYKYDVYQINTKGAEQSIIDEAEVRFDMGSDQKLFLRLSSEIESNKKGVKELKDKLNTLEYLNSNKPLAVQDIDNAMKVMYDVLTSMGISDKILTKDAFNVIVNRAGDTSKKKQLFLSSLRGKMYTVLNTVEKGVDIKSNENPLESKTFNKQYYMLARTLAENMDEYTESSTYENGKMYYSYCNPSYMGKMIRNLSNADNAKFKEYLDEHYGQYKFFKPKGGDKYLTEWADLLYKDFLNATNIEARDILSHKVELTFDKEGYKEYSEFKETMSLMLNFFKNDYVSSKGNKNKNVSTAWYRVPILANKPSNEFIRFVRFTDKIGEEGSYKKHILNGLNGTFQQELMRMRAVLEMSLKDKNERDAAFIKNRNIPDQYIPKGTSMDSNGRIRNFTIENLRNLIKANNEKPNGCNFKYLTVLNDIILGTYSANSKEGRLQKYIMNKMVSGFDNLNAQDASTNESEAATDFNNVIEEWLNKEYENTRKQWEKVGILETVYDEDTKQTHYKYLSNSSVTGTSTDVSMETVDKDLENYFWNDFYATLNIIQLTVGDMSYYKNIEDFQKRYAQLHAPALRFDEYAVDFNGKRVAAQEKIREDKGQTAERAYHRTIYIADDVVKSDIIPNVTKAFDVMISKANAAERPLLEAQKDKILTLFDEVNVADAQGYTSPTAYRKLKYMSGEWTRDMEDAYLELMKGNFDISNMNLLMQPLKPFVYTQIPKSTGESTLGMMPVPIQNKNSEYALMLSYAIMKGAGVDGSRISAIYDFMEESAYDGRELKNGVVQNKKEGTYNGRGIDTIQFESAVKSGLQGVININDDAIDDYRKISGNENMTEYDIVKNILKNSTYTTTANNKVEYNTSYVHEIPFEDYGEQQAVPDHFQDHEQPMGSQIRILDVADIEDTNEEIYEYKGEKISGKKLRRIYFELQSQNIEESIKELEKEFLLNTKVRKEAIAESLFRSRNDETKLKKALRTLTRDTLLPKGAMESILKYKEDISKVSSVKDMMKKLDNIASTEGINLEISRKERNYVLSNLLQKEILNDQRYGYDMLEAVQLNNEGEFNIPLNDATQSQRIQRLLNSIIKKRINKQNVKGGPVVQASVYGSSKNLDIKFKKQNGDSLMSFNEFKKRSTKEHSEEESLAAYNDYVQKEQGRLDYFEIYITCPSKELEELLISKSTKEKDYMSNPRLAEIDGIIPKGMLDMIGYRIPTEDKYSMQPCKVKGFLPRSAGEVVMLPKEITLLSGSDFDIDKLYVMTKSFSFRDGKFTLDEHGTDGRNNDIFDLQWSVLTNPTTLPKMFNPGSFAMQKESAKRLEVMEMVNNGELHGYTWKDVSKMNEKALDSLLSKGKQRNILFSTTQVYFHKQNMTAGKLIGIFANNNTSHAFVNIHNDFTDRPITLNPDNDYVTFSIDDTKIGKGGNLTIDALKAQDGITLTSKIMASYLAASVDAVKDPVLDKMNINNITAGPAMVLTRLGFMPDTVGLILKQPIVIEILNQYYKENLSGYKGIADVVAEKLEERGLLEASKSPVLSSNELANYLGKSLETVDANVRDKNVQNDVLILFNNLLKMSDDFNELTLCTKFNSMSNTVGPLISDTLITKARVDRFQNRGNRKTTSFLNAEGTLLPAIIEQNEMLNSFYKIFTKVSEEMFNGYFPHYDREGDFGTILNTLNNAAVSRGLTSDVINELENYFMAYKFSENGIMKFGSKYYLGKDFIEHVRNIRKNPALKNNAFINLLTEKKDKQNWYINIKGGGLSSEQQETIKEAWASLLESNDPAIRKFATGIAKYFIFRGGFKFNPKTVIHLMPNAVKEALPGYNSTMLDWKVNNPALFMNQFVRNIADNSKLSYTLLNRFNSKEAKKLGIKTTSTNTIQIPKKLLSQYGEDDLCFVQYGTSIGINKRSSGEYYVFDLVQPLGKTYNYIEFDANNLNLSSNDSNNTLSDISTNKGNNVKDIKSTISSLDLWNTGLESYLKDNDNKDTPTLQSKEETNQILEDNNTCPYF